MSIKTDFVPNCLMSKNIEKPLLCGVNTYPDTLDLRDLVLKTENQGSTPTCAAHAATSWAENINWRKRGIIQNLDPYKVYNYAKTVDGYPGVDGSTLDAVLKGILYYNMVDNTGDIYCFSDISTLKKIIHKYGPCLVAFDVSDIWMDHYNKTVLSGKPGNSCGGHAITAVGYNDAGLADEFYARTIKGGMANAKSAGYAIFGTHTQDAKKAGWDLIADSNWIDSISPYDTLEKTMKASSDKLLERCDNIYIKYNNQTEAQKESLKKDLEDLQKLITSDSYQVATNVMNKLDEMLNKTYASNEANKRIKEQLEYMHKIAKTKQNIYKD